MTSTVRTPAPGSTATEAPVTDAPAAEATTLRVENLTFTYPGTGAPALADISLATPPGSVTALVGPSGCGKTTLLKVIGGLLHPDTGHVRVGGTDVTRQPVSRRHIGWVPQQYALFEHMDVKSNIAFGLRAQKRPKAERLERIEEMLQLCRIAELADRSVDELSGGQRQRVAIARALAPHPRLLLLDEPLAALDPQLRGQLRADLRAMIRSAGVTTIMVTHDQDEALAMSDHLVMMNSGRIEREGAPNEVWAEPGTRWAASFLGHAVLVPIAGRPAAGRAEVLPGLEVPVADSGGDTLALRSLDFTIAPTDDAASSAAEETDAAEANGTSEAGGHGVVKDAEFRGDSYFVSVDTGDGPALPATSPQEVRIGERVTLIPTHQRNVPEVRS